MLQAEGPFKPGADLCKNAASRAASYGTGTTSISVLSGFDWCAGHCWTVGQQESMYPSAKITYLLDIVIYSEFSH